MNGPNHADKRSIERKLLCLYYLFFCVLYCPQNQSHNRAGGGPCEDDSSGTIPQETFHPTTDDDPLGMFSTPTD